MDDNRVEIELHHAYAPFLVDVAGSVPIIPEHVWSAVADTQKFDS